MTRTRDDVIYDSVQALKRAHYVLVMVSIAALVLAGGRPGASVGELLNEMRVLDFFVDPDSQFRLDGYMESQTEGAPRVFELAPTPGGALGEPSQGVVVWEQSAFPMFLNEALLLPQWPKAPGPEAAFTEIGEWWSTATGDLQDTIAYTLPATLMDGEVLVHSLGGATASRATLSWLDWTAPKQSFSYYRVALYEDCDLGERPEGVDYLVLCSAMGAAEGAIAFPANDDERPLLYFREMVDRLFRDARLPFVSCPSAWSSNSGSGCYPPRNFHGAFVLLSDFVRGEDLQDSSFLEIKGAVYALGRAESETPAVPLLGTQLPPGLGRWRIALAVLVAQFYFLILLSAFTPLAAAESQLGGSVPWVGVLEAGGAKGAYFLTSTALPAATVVWLVLLDWTHGNIGGATFAAFGAGAIILAAMITIRSRTLPRWHPASFVTRDP